MEFITINYHGKTHTHIPQMPISAQQWRVVVGQANASRSLRPRVIGQPKMKLTSLDVFLFNLTALLGAKLLGAILLGAILLGAILSKDGERETSEKSSRISYSHKLYHTISRKW